jgi:hypothetical protein
MTDRIMKQYQLANDWMPLRPDMLEFAEACGFETRRIGDRLEFRWAEVPGSSPGRGAGLRGARR